jgi:hypothetical protein
METVYRALAMQVEFVSPVVENMTPQQKCRRIAWLQGELRVIGEARP